jgi:hypothetical protein
MQRLNAIFSYIEHGFQVDDKCFNVDEFARARQAADRAQRRSCDCRPNNAPTCLIKRAHATLDSGARYYFPLPSLIGYFIVEYERSSQILCEGFETPNPIHQSLVSFEQ